MIESDLKSFHPEGEEKAVLANWQENWLIPRKRPKRKSLMVFPAKTKSHYYCKDSSSEEKRKPKLFIPN